MATLEEALFTRVTGYSGLASLIATRFYPILAPQNAVIPYITYTLITDIRFSNMGIDSPVKRDRIQLSIFAETKTQARAIHTQLRDALLRWRNASNPVVQDTFLSSSYELPEPERKLFQLVQEIEINYIEA